MMPEPNPDPTYGHPVPEPAPTGRAALATALKRCPLCDALVVAESTSCFVCEWHGEFLHDEEAVAHSVDGLLARCPELVEAMMEEVAARTTVWERLRRSLARSAVRVFTVGIEPPISHASLPPLA